MHWIEEAEQTNNKLKRKRETIHHRIDQKKSDVQKNWELNQEAYQEVVDKLADFVNRINNLPRESRLVFGRIEFKEKNSSLHNHLIKYSSSRRRIIRKFDGILSPYKAKHYKNTRNIFLSLSRKSGYVLIESKEINAPRIRLNEESEKSLFTALNFFKGKDRSIVKRDRNLFRISEIDDDFIIYLIDYLAFKNNGNRYFFQNSPSELDEKS
jgi:hypothetical protein